MKHFKFLLFLLPLLAMSCLDDDPDNCTSNAILDVTSVDAPVLIGNVNLPLNIAVNFTVENGCGSFNRFIEIENNNIRTIEVEANYRGCVCNQILLDLTTTYMFVTDRPGDYVLRFKSGTESAIIVNVTIN